MSNHSRETVRKDTGERALALRDARKVVIKVGTRLLTDIDGASKAQRVYELVKAIADLRAEGVDVILVSSGAIGAGMGVLNTEKRPRLLPQLQSHAAVGQCRLMYLYETACEQFGFHSGQILLTADDVQNRERHLNVTSCLDSMLNSGVLPVINENDSVRVDEIKFGDNDMLAALVAVMVRADLTIMLTSVDGLRELKENGLGARISVVKNIGPYVRSMAGDTADQKFSVGGMATKLNAASSVVKAGENLWIADGSEFNILKKIMAGDDVGTLFTAAKPKRMHGHQRFLAFFADFRGDITVDSGAAEAVASKGRSLLPSGVIDVSGDFKRGDTVRICTVDNLEIARGVTNYNADEVRQIKGCQTAEIRDILHYDAYDTVVHRNYMAII
ncbi:MAG: glutamate 5-kinase [Lentisphaeria bacterium]